MYLFLEEGKGGEKERERNINLWLPLMCPLLGTWPTTQACALTGNQTSHPLVHRLVLNPLSHTSQGLIPTFNPATGMGTSSAQMQPALNHLYLYLLLPWSFPVAKVWRTCRTHPALAYMLARSAGKLMSVELPLTNEGRALVAKCFPFHLLVNSSGPPLISFFSRFKQQSLWRPTL